MSQSKPETLRIVEQALKGKIAEYQSTDPVFYAKDIDSTERRLKQIRWQWSRSKHQPLVEQMVQVVESTVSAYLTDFYDVDLSMLLDKGFQVPFFWWVHCYGTELIFLTDSPQRISSVRMYLRHLCEPPEREEFVKYDDARYFVGDPATGQLIEVFRYDEVTPYMTVRASAS